MRGELQAMNTFVVGINVPGIGRDPDVLAEVVSALCRASTKGAMIQKIGLELGRVVLTIRAPSDPKVNVLLAQECANVIQGAIHRAAPLSTLAVSGKVLDMSEWAFGADKRELSPQQRQKVKEEILAQLAESAPHEQDTIRRIAEKIGRK